MAPNTALAFMFSGAAIALGDVHTGRRSLLAPALAGLIMALSLLALLGYVSGVTSFYGIQGVTQMAIPTTLGFIALGVGLLLAHPDRPPMRLIARDTPGGAMLRRLVPGVVIVPLTLGGLRIAGQAAGLYDTQVGTWLSVVAIIALALPLTWRMANSVDKAEDHRRHAEALLESEARIRKIVETAHDAFVSIDGEGRIIAWNPAAERLLGWTADEALGRDIAIAVPARLRAEHRDALERATVAPFSVETVRLHRDGHEIPVEIAIAASEEADGWVFNGFLRDISERLHAHEELRAAQHEVLQRLAVAAEYRDDDTGQHTRRVGDLSARLAASLGLPDDEVELIRRAAPLHDVGKIGIPDAILLKPGRLTGAEFDRVKTHTLIGAQMLAGRGFPLLECAERVARSHHERWDGAGYPHGLAGRDIPLVGRIVALADVFDALTHDRPYKSAWSHEAALTEIDAQRGRQFDPELVDAFLALFPASRDAGAPGRVAA
jgi:PAS domain S-box-containing protein/putative nucleotidyltransferase with HDIG domain